MSQGLGPKNSSWACARTSPPKMSLIKKLKFWRKTQDDYRLTSFFSPPACGRQQKHYPQPALSVSQGRSHLRRCRRREQLGGALSQGGALQRGAGVWSRIMPRLPPERPAGARTCALCTSRGKSPGAEASPGAVRAQQCEPGSLRACRSAVWLMCDDRGTCEAVESFLILFYLI